MEQSRESQWEMRLEWAYRFIMAAIVVVAVVVATKRVSIGLQSQEADLALHSAEESATWKSARHSSD